MEALDALLALKQDHDPSYATFADEVHAAAAYGKGLHDLLASSGKAPKAPELAAALRVPARPSSPPVTVGRARPLITPIASCACPDECEPYKFANGGASWTKGTPLPKPFHAAAFFGWRDFRTIDTKDDPKEGTLSMFIRWTINPSTGVWSLTRKGAAPQDSAFVHLDGMIFKNPYLVWEAARVRVHHYLWFVVANPAPLNFPWGFPIMSTQLLDVTSAWSEGNKALTVPLQSVWTMLPSTLVNVTQAGSTFELWDELEVRWVADGGSRVRFTVQEYTVRTTDVEKQFALCD